jgi:hypothetical protein
MSDQLIARPLPKHRTAQTQNKHIYTPNIHALSGIRTHDHSAQASEDSSCFRSLGYRDRPTEKLPCCRTPVEDHLTSAQIFSNI